MGVMGGVSIFLRGCRLCEHLLEGQLFDVSSDQSEGVSLVMLLGLALVALGPWYESRGHVTFESGHVSRTY